MTIAAILGMVALMGMGYTFTAGVAVNVFRSRIQFHKGGYSKCNWRRDIESHTDPKYIRHCDCDTWRTWAMLWPIALLGAGIDHAVTALVVNPAKRIFDAGQRLGSPRYTALPPSEDES